MLPQEVIRIKRDGGKLSPQALHEFVQGVADGSVGDGQVAAFAMAVLFKGMELDERISLTTAMRDSGTVMSWDLPGPVLDKHSTGGVGDKVSLILGPIVAACGGYVPMIAGRGLGHTGGTVDKLEAIAGYQTRADSTKFRQCVEKIGCAIIGQTNDLAPADRRMYAIRDVTATVESLDLITASILAKKLAEGLDGLVMDVKFGTGAFMRDYKDAEALADSIAQVARGAGVATTALLTDMNRVLGRTAGNANEVRESIDMLQGKPTEPRLHEVTVKLCSEMLLLGKLAPDMEAAQQKVENALSSGTAAEVFAKMISQLGGPTDLMENPDKYLPIAKIRKEVWPDEAGIVEQLDVREAGMAIVALGGGRVNPSDDIDFSVGMEDVAAPGDKVGVGEKPLAVIYALDEASAEQAATRLTAAFTLQGQSVAPPQDQLIAKRLAA